MGGVEDSDNEITLATDMVSRAASSPSTNVPAQTQWQSRLPSRRWADMEDSDDETHVQGTLHLPTSVERVVDEKNETLVAIPFEQEGESNAWSSTHTENRYD